MWLFKYVDRVPKLLNPLIHEFLSMVEFFYLEISIEIDFRSKPIILWLKILPNFIQFFVVNILSINRNDVIEQIHVFVDERFVLVFFIVIFFYFQILQSHLLFFLLHFGNLLIGKFLEVVDLFYLYLADWWGDFVE